jgi:hypothetical protein
MVCLTDFFCLGGICLAKHFPLNFETPEYFRGKLIHMFLVHCLLNHQNVLFQKLFSAKRGLSDTYKFLKVVVFFFLPQLVDPSGHELKLQEFGSKYNINKADPGCKTTPLQLEL